MYGEDNVGPNWKLLWRIGVQRADEVYWSTYVWETGQGVPNKTFVIASDATVSVCKKMMVYFSTGTADIKKYCRKLKEDWQTFNKNPNKYGSDLIDVVTSFDLTRARDHLLDTKAFPNANKNKWKPSEADIWTIVEKDLLFQQKAFVIVTHNPRMMGPEEAIRHLREDWRYCTTQNGGRVPVDYQAFNCKGYKSLDAYHVCCVLNLSLSCSLSKLIRI